MFFWKIY